MPYCFRGCGTRRRRPAVVECGMQRPPYVARRLSPQLSRRPNRVSGLPEPVGGHSGRVFSSSLVPRGRAQLSRCRRGGGCARRAGGHAHVVGNPGDRHQPLLSRAIDASGAGCVRCREGRRGRRDRRMLPDARSADSSTSAGPSRPRLRLALRTAVSSLTASASHSRHICWCVTAPVRSDFAR